MTELEVPQLALDAMWLCDQAKDEHEIDEQCVLGVAIPVVIAELRRIADWYVESARLGGDAYLAFAGELRRRAKQLEEGDPR